ncbi:MAG TPA: NAD-dependent succinate-semialdehyde dehydrogenase [Longimicrobium sp.]|nr:NAD-dependent succinate-semialdehyde dehydrogenase [Longimicrobium sp.]
MPITTINPTTGEELRTEWEKLTAGEIDQKLAKADEAFRAHRRTPFAERAGKMSAAAEILEREKERLGRMMTTEMGKTLKSAIAEAEKCAWACRYYAEHGEAYMADQAVETSAKRSYVRYLPIGPVLAVMPWNFPFWQVFRFAAPALMAGNVGLLKHASNVPRCAMAIEDVFRRAGFGEGVFQTLLVGADAVPGILDDPRVKAATLTGSTPAGSSVAERAGKNLKKTVLELGGSDPFIVLPSADLDAAATTAAKARCINNGQSCIAAKRFIVHGEVYDAFTERFVRAMEAQAVGDPMREETEVGPLAMEQTLEDAERQVRDSIAAGAKVLTGGERIDGPGFFYRPTILAEIPESAPAYREEVFAPVASLFRVRDADEAIALANDSDFGLGSSVWTRDPAEARRFVDELEAGMTYVNAMVSSDPRLPFGGVKQSGYGRELSRVGMHEFVNIKSVWMEEEGPDAHPESE